MMPLPPSVERLLASLGADEQRYAKDAALVRGDQLLRRVIQQIREAFTQHALESLDFKQASDEMGLSESTLGRLILTGHARNIGTPHRPRIARQDLERYIRRPRSERAGLKPPHPTLHQET